MSLALLTTHANRSCEPPKKKFAVIDSKMTHSEQFLVFKGIYKGEFPKIDFGL